MLDERSSQRPTNDLDGSTDADRALSCLNANKCRNEQSPSTAWSPPPCPDARYPGDYCRRNSCPTCGPAIAAKLHRAAIAAGPTLFITFTRDSSASIPVAKMVKWVQTERFDIEGAWSLELGDQNSGLHAHMVAKVGDDIDIEMVQSAFDEIAVQLGSGFVLVENIRTVEGAVRYLTKNMRRGPERRAQHLQLNVRSILRHTKGFLPTAPKRTYPELDHAALREAFDPLLTAATTGQQG